MEKYTYGSIYKLDEEKLNEVRMKKELITDSGMWAIWDYETYKEIDDYDTWEPLLNYPRIHPSSISG